MILHIIVQKIKHTKAIVEKIILQK